MKISPRKAILLSPLLIILFTIVILYLSYRDSYFLNKTVRLISLRLTQFERLSFIRKDDYKFEFHEDDYLISFFNKRNKRWEIFARHEYPQDIIPSIENLEIILARGRISHFKIKGKKIDLKSYLILNFYRSKRPTKTRGIIFYKDGSRRALGL